MLKSAARYSPFWFCFVVMVFAMMFGKGFMPAAAQNAMRAPLNIVPPAMQQSIGQPKAQRSSDKLAPRVAARQSKRAVRAVAAAPGSDSGIVQVGQLGSLQDAPIGLQTGYGSELWRGARLAFIADQMARLPKELSLAALREAELKLHRSTTAAPVGTVDGASWYAARLNRFLALGDTASVLELEQLTGAVSSDPYAARALVLAHLGRGAGAAACAVAAPKRGTRGYADTLRFFMQHLVYCQLRAGEFEKAGLTLQLNEKSLGEDKFYRELAFLMSAQTQPVFGSPDDVAAAKAEEKEPPLVVPSVLTPMQLALLQLVGYGITVALEQLPPYFMQALAEDYAQPAVTQLGAALAAMRHGTLSPERFSQLSQLTDLSAYQTTPEGLDIEVDDAAGLDAERNVPEPTEAVFLALSLLTVDAQTPESADSAQAVTILKAVLTEAEARGLWRDMVLLLDDRLLTVTQAEQQIPLYPEDAPLSDFGLAAASATTPLAITEGDRAFLMPALQLLQAHKQLEQIETLGFTPSAVAARLMDFGEAVQPLENLIAALPETAPDAPINGSAETVSNNNFDNTFDSQPSFNDLPFADGGGIDAPADTRPHPIADWQIFDADYAAGSNALKAYLARELAIYQGLGFELPATYRAPSAAEAAPADVQRVQKLADNKWIGDLLLALVDMYGGDSAATLENGEVIVLLAALRQADLNDEAENLAGELLHNAAGRLSLADPSALLGAAAVEAELVLP